VQLERVEVWALSMQHTRADHGILEQAHGVAEVPIVLVALLVERLI
jgi:hypothetical protein